MADNVQKLPFGRSLQEHARRKVLEHIQLMSGRAPATLMKAHDKTNTVWMVKFDTDETYTLPMITVPVHGSEFQRVPYQQGAKGFVGAADIETGNMTGLRSARGPVDFTRPGNLSSMVWHPTGNTEFKPAIDPNAHETYGAASGTITHDGTAKSLVTTHAQKGTSASSGGDGSGQPGPHEMATSTQGTSIKTPMPHTLQAQNATLDQQGNQTNEGTHTAGKSITATTGDIMAAAGSVLAAVSMAAPSGSFGSGSIGGLSLSGGRMGGGGGGGSGFQVASEEISADTLRTAKFYTVAQLNHLLPPSAGMRGVRALVSDATAPPTTTTASDGTQTSTPGTTVKFGAVLQGGGTLDSGAICLLQSDGSFQWCAG